MILRRVNQHVNKALKIKKLKKSRIIHKKIFKIQIKII